MASSKPREERRITVEQLVSQLRNFPQQAEVSFSGLAFYRLKQRGPDLVQVEFNEVVYRRDDGTMCVEDGPLD
jgi:hypothetical protein